MNCVIRLIFLHMIMPFTSYQNNHINCREKPVAFKYGQRPFQNVICEGVEEGIRGMKVGGKRVLQIPDGLGPPGVEIPPGQVLTYEAELTEVLQGYF